MDFSLLPEIDSISNPIPGPQSLPGVDSSLFDLDTAFKGLDQGFGYKALQDAPIELTGKNLSRFKDRVMRLISSSEIKMSTIHSEVKKDRQWALTIPKTPRYEGGPDITLPIVAGKVAGLAAHIRDAIEQRPIASFSPEGIGKAAEMGIAVGQLSEAYLEREINRTLSRELLLSSAPKEVAEVGNVILEINLTEIGDETFVQFGKTIRIENFYVDRINVDNLWETSCFYRDQKRHYELEEGVEEGIYDADAVKSIYGSSSYDVQSIENEKNNFIEGDTFAEENSIRDLICGYMRFRPEGEKETNLYEFIVAENRTSFLAIRRTGFTKAFDAPPLALFRIGKRAGTLFGRGLGRRLESEQKMADKYINNHLAATDFIGSPAYLYRSNSPFGNALERTAKKGFFPGQAIPTQGMPNVKDVEPIQMLSPGTGFNMQNVEIASRFADTSTFSESSIGSESGSSRKTLGQFRIEVNNGTLRLRSDLFDFAYDAANALRMYWAAMVAFKVIPAGVVEIEDGGKLIGSREVDAADLSQSIARIIDPMVSSGQMTMDEAAKFQVMYNDLLTDGAIPGIRRPDLVVSLSGTRVIADKVAELQLQFQLLPMAMSLFEGAKQDSYMNYWLRSIITSAGFKDVAKRVPPDPNVEVDPATRQALVAPYQNMLATSSNMI